MRLWHYDLFDVLPRQQLLSQWRELNSIFANQNKHILINFIYDYDKKDLLIYTNKLIQEFAKRGYEIKSIQGFDKYFVDISNDYFCGAKCFSQKMTDRYLKQCLYNLQEKYDCMAITQQEWDKIKNKYNEII